MRYIYIDASTQKLFCIAGNFNEYKEYVVKTNMDLIVHLPQIYEHLIEYHCNREGVSNFGDIKNDLICLCTGPGSLTGLRVAMTFFRTIALVKKIPIVGIDLFTLAEYKLKEQSKTAISSVRVVVPAFLDHYFCLDLDEANEKSIAKKPRLVHVTEINTNKKNYGINFSSEYIEEIKIEAELLHQFILKYYNSIEYNYNSLLNTFPSYIIPSQAELKWKKKDDYIGN